MVADIGEEIARHLEPSSCLKLIPDQIQPHLMALADSKIVSEEPLTSGLSGSTVVQVQIEDGKKYVVKFNKKEPEVILHEIDGRELLESAGYEARIGQAQMVMREGALPFMVLDWIQGTPLESRMQNGSITPDGVQTVISSLADFKREAWQKQQKNPPEFAPFISFHRARWDSTAPLFEAVLPVLSEQFCISAQDLYHFPLSHKGMRGPSLSDVQRHLQRFLQENPPYTVIAHNDANATNVMVNDTGNWKLIDPEWAAANDPAEAYCRILMQKKASLLQDTRNARIVKNGKEIIVDASFIWPDAVVHAQKTSMAYLKTMQESLHDPDFTRRVFLYTAAFYIREVGYAKQRLENLDTSAYPLAMASLYTACAQNSELRESFESNIV